MIVTRLNHAADKNSDTRCLSNYDSGIFFSLLYKNINTTLLLSLVAANIKQRLTINTCMG